MNKKNTIGIIRDYSKKESPSQIISYILKPSGYDIFLVKDDGVIYNDRLINSSDIENDDIVGFLMDNGLNPDFIILDTQNKSIVKKLLDRSALDCIVDFRIENKKSNQEINSRILYEGLKKSGVVILNSDMNNDVELFRLLQNKILITYGYDSKATVTTSSIPLRDETTLICCVQRGIPTIVGNDVEPIEFPIKFYNYNFHINISDMLGVITFGLRHGLTIETMQEALKEYKGNNISHIIN